MNSAWRVIVPRCCWEALLLKSRHQPYCGLFHPQQGTMWTGDVLVSNVILLFHLAVLGRWILFDEQSQQSVQICGSTTTMQSSLQFLNKFGKMHACMTQVVVSQDVPIFNAHRVMTSHSTPVQTRRACKQAWTKHNFNLAKFKMGRSGLFLCQTTWFHVFPVNARLRSLLKLRRCAGDTPFAQIVTPHKFDRKKKSRIFFCTFGLWKHGSNSDGYECSGCVGGLFLSALQN